MDEITINNAKTKPIEEVINYLKLAAEKYYNDEEIIDDEIYDKIYDIAYERQPKNPFFTKVGAKISTGKKEKLPLWMGSMDKLKGNEIINWIKTHKGPYIISAKLNGVSGLLQYKRETQSKYRLTAAYTRGNGIEGKNIMHLIPHISNIPQLISMAIAPENVANIYIRGEFIIKKKTFEMKYLMKYPKPLSFIVGNINHKTPTVEELADIEFIPYELADESLQPQGKQLSILGKMGFTTVEYDSHTKIDEEYLLAALRKMADESKYEIDGIIVYDDNSHKRATSKNPSYAFAYKHLLDTNKIVESTVVKVIWNVSKHGRIIPTIEIAPIKIDGDTITYTTGFNAKYIMENKIGPGAILQIVKSGDVIPHVKNIVKSAAAADMPEDMKYIWDSTKTHIHIDALENDDMKRKQLVHFFKALGTKNIGDGIINKLVAAGYNTLSSILSLTQKQLIKIDGFKEKLAQNIMKELDAIINNPINLATLMTASNAFGIGIGERKLSLLIEKYGDKWDTIVMEDIIEVDGFSDKTAAKYLEGMQKFKEFLEEHSMLKYRLPTIVKTPNVAITSNTLFGKNIVLTGTRDAAVRQIIKERHAVESTSVSQSTFIVVALDKNSNSNKIVKAKELKITILTPEEFISVYGSIS